ncbi:hypothetical protein HDU79_006711 [Rhizoclosmatium sp. JEL0117]|nr:hypothetical protein HDU79_006711 [Rhizoclosmatium sp. JEL0117]
MLLNEKKGRIYATIDPSTNTASALVFTYERVTLSTHVWLAVTGRDHRRKGLMRMLFETVEKDVRDHGVQSVTVNTLPEVFVNMPVFLERQGYVLIGDEWLGEKGRTRKAKYGKSLQEYKRCW